jgi:hypothetical protein
MTFDRGHALVIGVGAYARAPRLDVPITAQDAQQIATVLRDPRSCGYPAEQVTLLCGTEATRDGILQALDALAGRTSADDTLFLFYSGHGDYGEDGYYLTTHETEIREGKVVVGTGLREKELLERLNKLSARRAFLIFNACHSGALGPSALGAEESGASLPDALTTALLGTGEGRVVITACRAEQRSYFVPDDPTTLFAQALIDGLQGRGVDNRRGYISVFDLYDYTFTTVSGEVRRRWKLIQEPELTIHKGVGALAVALYRGKAPEGSLGEADRPALLGGATREVDPAESSSALQQILSGQLNLAAARDISGNTIVGRDQINAQGSQGLINQASGPINQNFGQQHIVDTGGGDYAGGNIDKRRGKVFVEGGVVYGSVTGLNAGDIFSPTPGMSLEQALQRLRDTIAKEQQRDEDLAGELQRVELDLSGALRAQGAGNQAQRQRLLDRAKQDLGDLAGQYTILKRLAAEIERVQ